MAKKSAIKRASKMWPRTERLSAAESILNEHEGAVFDDTKKVTPADAAKRHIDPSYDQYEADILPVLQDAAKAGLDALTNAFTGIPKSDNKTVLWTFHKVALKGMADQAIEYEAC